MSVPACLPAEVKPATGVMKPPGGSLSTLRPELDLADEERQQVLCSPLRSPEVNPEAHRAKVRFWTEVLSDWLSHERRALFTVAEAGRACQWGELTPRALPAVVRHLSQTGQIVPHPELRAQLQAQVEALARPASWWRGLSSALATRVPRAIAGWWGTAAEDEATAAYVHPQRLEELSSRLAARLAHSEVDALSVVGSTRFVTHSTIVEALNHLEVEVSSRELVHLQLSADRIVRWATINEVEVAKLDGEPWTPQEAALVALVLARDRVEAELEALDTRTETYRGRVRADLTSGRRSLAKATLGRVKACEKRRDQLFRMLHQLEELATSLESTALNQVVASTLKSASASFQAAQKELNLEQAQDLVDECQELIQQSQAVDQILSGLDPALDEEDAALEEELRQLCQADEAAQKRPANSASEPESTLNVEAELAGLQIRDAPRDKPKTAAAVSPRPVAM